MENKFNWLNTSKPKGKVAKDVRVIPYETKTNKGATITFTDSKWLQFAENERIEAAVVDSRIYFRGNQSNGYKLSRNGKRYSTHIYGEDLFELVNKNSGCYYLQYDTNYNLYYIDTSNKRD